MSLTVRITLIMLSLGVLAAIAVGVWGTQQLQPVEASLQAACAQTTQECTLQRFVVPKGSGAQKIANKLESENLIRSSLVFRIYAKYTGLETQFQAGSYELSPGMTTQEIAETLTQGSEDIWITLLEGWRTEEMAQYLESQELPEFNKAEFLELAASSEGMLFPDSYLVPRESDASTIYALLTRTFEQKVTSGLANEIAADDLSLEEILTLAALIQREAKSEQDMRHVSSILRNRVDINMALGVDATLQYIAGYNAQEDDWWAQPDIAVKQSTSPYNTYTNPGLPPGPICNPGLQAIKAALNPLETDDLFYLHAPDGTMYYAEDLDTHNAYIDRYLR